MCRNKYGKGQAYYVAFRDTGDYLRELYGGIIAEAGIKPSICGKLGAGVVSHSRSDGENDYVFIENYSDAPSYFIADAEYTNMETAKSLWEEEI